MDTLLHPSVPGMLGVEETVKTSPQKRHMNLMTRPAGSFSLNPDEKFMVGLGKKKINDKAQPHKAVIRESWDLTVEE